MNGRTFFSFIFFILVLTLLVLYWLVSFETTSFDFKSKSAEFNEYSFNQSNMQFYDNMRFSSKDLSYKISDCPLNKREEMEKGFDYIENLTVLRFIPVSSNEMITVSCESKNIIEEGLFVAGEGGPTNFTQTDNFNVILKGSILLVKNVPCETPIVPIHELLHVLGFDHSKNDNNVMYPVAKCGQTIGKDIPALINSLYAVPSYPDLSFDNASATMHGRYIDADIEFRNHGLAESGRATLLIYADDTLLKEIEVEPLKVGYGKIITLSNIFIKKLGEVNEIIFKISYGSEELNKENNIITLQTKK